MTKKDQARLVKLAEETSDLFQEITHLASQMESIVSDAQDTFDARSERWQETDRGEAERELIDTWNDYVGDLTACEVDAPDVG